MLEDARRCSNTIENVQRRSKIPKTLKNVRRRSQTLENIERRSKSLLQETLRERCFCNISLCINHSAPLQSKRAETFKSDRKRLLKETFRERCVCNTSLCITHTTLFPYTPCMHMHYFTLVYIYSYMILYCPTLS